MFNVHPTISTIDISRSTLSVSDIKLKDKDTIHIAWDYVKNIIFFLMLINN